MYKMIAGLVAVSVLALGCQKEEKTETTKKETVTTEKKVEEKKPAMSPAPKAP